MVVNILDGQGIVIGHQKYIFPERLSTGFVKVTFDQATFDIGIHFAENFHKVLIETMEHTFSTYIFRKQALYLCRHLISPILSAGIKN